MTTFTAYANIVNILQRFRKDDLSNYNFVRKIRGMEFSTNDVIIKTSIIKFLEIRTKILEILEEAENRDINDLASILSSLMSEYWIHYGFIFMAYEKYVNGKSWRTFQKK